MNVEDDIKNCVKRRIEVGLLQLGKSYRIDEPLLNTKVEVEVVKNNLLSAIARDIVVRVRQYVLQNSVRKTQTIAIPKTWWQHFKRDHFPEWLLKRFPHKCETLIIATDVLRVCPHYTRPLFGQSHINFLTTGGHFGAESKEIDGNCYCPNCGAPWGRSSL